MRMKKVDNFATSLIYASKLHTTKWGNLHIASQVLSQMVLPFALGLSNLYFGRPTEIHNQSIMPSLRESMF